MPLLESELLARYPDGLFAAGVYVDTTGTSADQLMRDNGFEIPMLYDIEGQALRLLREARRLYPLDVVIDREGKIAYLGDSMETAFAIVDELMER